MGFLTKAFESRAQGEQKLIELFRSSQQSTAGVDVSEVKVLGISSYWSAVRLYMDTLSTIPRTVHRRNGDRRETATEHPAHAVLMNPNGKMNGQQTWAYVVLSYETRGVAYGEVEKTRDGMPKAFWPFHPDWVEPVELDKRLTYIVREPGKAPREVPRDRMFHLRLMPNSYTEAYSPLRIHRESFGLAIAAEQFGASWFGNGAKPQGIFKFHERVPVPEQKRLLDQWNAEHRGARNSNKHAVMPLGMDYMQISLSPEDSQFLGTRNFQVREMARITRTTPSKLYDLEFGTYSNTEQQALEFEKDSVRPRVVAIEEELNRVMFPAREQGTYYIKFNTAGLLRGDAKTRWEVYNIALNNGVFNPDIVLGLEDMNPIEDGSGKVYLRPTNLQPSTKFLEPDPEPEPEPEPEPAQPVNEDDEQEEQEQDDRGLDYLVDALADAQNREPSEVNADA